MFSMKRSCFIGLLGGVLLLACAPAAAKSSIAVLAFGGDRGPSVRKRLVGPLSRQYRVVHGDKVLDACDALGISMSRGRNLARCAQKAGVVAVVGGAVGGDILSLVVFSGKSGKVIGKGSVVCESRLSAADLRDALTIIAAGLRKAPRGTGAPPPLTRPRPRPRPRPDAVVEPEPDDGLEFDPDGKDDGDGKGDFSFEPEPVDRKPAGSATGNPDEDPLDNAGAYKPGSGSGSGNSGATRKGTPVAKVTKKPLGGGGSPRLIGVVGLGTWIRDFSIHDPVLGANGKCKDPCPGYNSSAAFALRLLAKIRPAAFFTDGFASMFYARLQFQTTLGLQSGTGKEGEKQIMNATSFYEFTADVGLDWNILKNSTGPHVELGLGGGMMDFAIDWESSQKHILPDASYSFFLIRAGFNWPFHRMVGAHFSFDYRVVGGTGEVEDPDTWYGPSSTGGINLGVGIDAAYQVGKQGEGQIIASLEYTYTRYFYTFTEADARVGAGQKAAGGALDILHGFVVSVGYSL